MNIEEKYLLWLNHPNMDQDLKEELVSMDEKQKEDALSFAQKLAKESDDKTIDEAISKVDKFKSNKTIKKIKNCFNL